jgi:NADPH:quinone reductase-like Zn-dependent oxidoreductase
MRAIVYHRYGPPEVVGLAEVPKPAPKDAEVLIRVRATTVTSGDWRARSLSMPAGFGLLGRLVFGIGGPRQPILGTELSGQIESVGKLVTRFKVGDEVIGFTGAKMGCHAEYRCMPEDGLIAPKPPDLTHEQAAGLLFGGTTALDFLRRGKIAKGEKVLINGASGAVGTAAVQLARHFGAEVCGVCSAANVDLVRSIGADSVIDYSAQDFTENGERYDIIMDTAGTAGLARSKASLVEGGRLLLVLAPLSGVLGALVRPGRVIAGPARERAQDVQELAGLARSGALKPVIDRVFPFADAVDAHRLVDSGRKRGSVVLSLQDDP